MIADPLEPFRRAAASTLVRMERAFVERALTLPGMLVGEAISGAHRVVTNNAQVALDAVQMLVRLPHHLADMLADSWRGPDARVLTARERLAVADAFGYRARPDLLRIVNGPGLSSIPRAAFENRNPAITIGNTIYLRPASNCPKKDLMSKPDGAALLMHEVCTQFNIVRWVTLNLPYDMVPIWRQSATMRIKCISMASGVSNLTLR